MKPDSLPPCEVLREILSTGRVVLPNGEFRRASAGIGAEHSIALYRAVLRERPEVVVETGMGQGVSTLSMLCALEQTGGRLISIDPYNVDWTEGRDAALHAVQRAGYAARHQFIEENSEFALPRLRAEGLRIQFGYIDGHHGFEHAFIDFFYLDCMLAPGGLLGFNNAGWPSVFSVIRYLQKHRAYIEEDVGLKADYSARNPLFSIMRRILRRPRQDRYFRKDRSA